MKLRYRIGTKVIYWIWRVLFGFKVEGRENIPLKGGTVIASNHLSNYDPPLVGTGAWMRECYFFAKQELFNITKFYSWLIHIFNAYPVNTRRPDKKALKWTKKLLEEGRCVVFFPEGTRNLRGGFLRFNPGVGWLAMQTRATVIPTAIKGVNTPLMRQLIRKSRTYVKFGSPIFASKFEHTKRGRELITKEIERKVKELYESLPNT
jgi:1-acyl-sn-glycerol-3-phosphate acyltransferase